MVARPSFCVCLSVAALFVTKTRAETFRYVLVGGQSNCQGYGSRNHLQELIDTGDAEWQPYGSPSSNFTERDDVTVSIWPERGITGPLFPRFGNDKNSFGIEMGAGWVLGDYFFEDPVLIVKYCDVSALAEDWLPPSSGGGTGGNSYNLAVATYQAAISNVNLFFPAYEPDEDEIELAAFVWFHGYADVFDAGYLSQYEANLANLLDDIEAAFPTLKGFVVVEMGGGGETPTEAELEMRSIQARVVESKTSDRYKLVESSPFSGGAPIDGEAFFHYFGRADNFIRLGRAIGDAIVDISQLDDDFLGRLRGFLRCFWARFPLVRVCRAQLG